MVKKLSFLKHNFLILFLPKLKNKLVKTICNSCHRFWFNWDLDTFGPSKLMSASKFCEWYLCCWQKMARNGCKLAKRKSCLFFKWPVFSYDFCTAGNFFLELIVLWIDRSTLCAISGLSVTRAVGTIFFVRNRIATSSFKRSWITTILNFQTFLRPCILSLNVTW